MQGVLLRFLENGELQRVGSTRPRSTNVRIIAATNRDLQQQIDAGTFRLDMYYRLNVIHIDVPPLRERREDIPLLLDHFLAINSSRYQQPKRLLTPPAIAALSRYDWPGNVRQLKNVVERVALRGPRPIELSHLPVEIIRHPRQDSRDHARTPPELMNCLPGCCRGSHSGLSFTNHSWRAISPGRTSATSCGLGFAPPAADTSCSWNCSTWRPTTTARCLGYSVNTDAMSPFNHFGQWVPWSARLSRRALTLRGERQAPSDGQFRGHRGLFRTSRVCLLRISFWCCPFH